MQLAHTAHAMDWADHLECLDCTPVLRSAEKKRLAYWITNPPKYSFFDEEGRRKDLLPLQRFLEPIKHMLEHIGYEDEGGRYSYACCLVLLKEMHERQSTYWTWDESAWIEIVGKTSASFATRKGELYAFQSQRLISRIELRPLLLLCAYSFSKLPVFTLAHDLQAGIAARRWFGEEAVREAMGELDEGVNLIGRPWISSVPNLKSCLYQALLHQRSALLQDITLPLLQHLYQQSLSASFKRAYIILSRALHSLGILQEILTPETESSLELEQLPIDFQAALIRWRTYLVGLDSSESTIKHLQHYLTRAVRWTMATYPHVTHPRQWTREIAHAFKEAVKEMKRGDWCDPRRKADSNADLPLAAGSKVQMLSAVRQFFDDWQDLGIIPRKFTPQRDLKTPRRLLQSIRPDPRVISEKVWIKLLAAGLALTEEDVPHRLVLSSQGTLVRELTYPLPLLQALASTWLLSGLRSDEIMRLEVGCVRQPDPLDYPWSGAEPLASLTCILRVPAHKTGASFEKPVDSQLGTHLGAWERVRPPAPTRLDTRSGRRVHYLFQCRGRKLGSAFLNDFLIPLLCKKAGVADHDSGWRITSHRARATIATRLYVAGMNPLEIQKWLGHRWLRSTLYYLRIDEKALNAAFARALDNRAGPADRLGDRSLWEQSADLKPAFWEDDDDTGGSLRHLRPKPCQGNHAQLVAARNSLRHVQQSMSLLPEQSQLLRDSLALLETLYTGSPPV